MLRLMSETPEMSDIIITVFAARRRRMLEAERIGLVLIGGAEDRDVRRIASYASRNRIPIRGLTLGSEDARAQAVACGMPADAPAVILNGNQVIDPPTPRGVARALGLDLPLDCGDVMDLVIVGGGSTGVAAGIYAGAEGLSALVIEDPAIGGQAGTSGRIENYMGFPTGISGGDLVGRGEFQALKFWHALCVCGAATGSGTVSGGGRRFPRRTQQHQSQGAGPCGGDGRSVSAVAFGRARPVGRRWGVLRGQRDRGAVVPGWRCSGDWGGNSAGQEAMDLARTAKHIHVLVRGKGLAASM